MSGDRVVFFGDAMTTVVHGVREVTHLLGEPPVVVGGLAVLSRLARPYRATVDLDIVDRGSRDAPHLEVLRSAEGATAIAPAAVLLVTPMGPVKVDVLAVRQVEIDAPSDDPGDRLHASAHAWANDTATPLMLEAIPSDGPPVVVVARVSQPGPLVAMKLQAIMNRSAEKRATDLMDIVRLALDAGSGPLVRAGLADLSQRVSADVALHVDLWFVRRRAQSLRALRQSGDADISMDDLDLVADLLLGACRRG